MNIISSNDLLAAARRRNRLDALRDWLAHWAFARRQRANRHTARQLAKRGML